MKGHALRVMAVAALACLASNACGGGSGYGGSPTNPGLPAGGSVGATITIRSDGVAEPNEVRIAVGDRVRFINQDSRQHHPTSNPHLLHTDCPAANLPILSTGQSETTQPFDRAMACGMHDHLNPDLTPLQVTIRVGGAQGPGGPVYVKH
jgi:plastocyanin